MINSITVVGNMGADPEMRYLPTGMAITTFLVYDHYKYGQGKEDTTKFKVCFFAKQAENANQFLHKGDLVAVTGRLRLKSFDGRDGNTVTYLEIVGSDFRALQNRRDSGVSDDQLTDGYGDVDDLPF